MTWLDRLKAGLGRSSERLAGRITDVFRGHKVDAETLQELEDLLITADLGVGVATRLSDMLRRTRFDKAADPTDIARALSMEIAAILDPVARPLDIDGCVKPFVVLVCGVNGSGKTTTIGKLASRMKAEGRSVMLAAGDTFRAAAVDQLVVWGARADVPVVSRGQGTDPASLAFEAVERARDEATDVLLIDTAGRLQNKSGLMDELGKMVRVIGKQYPSAPHATLLVMDSTVGQNAFSQVSAFMEMVNVSGLVMTKLDGTARGGVVVGLAERFGLPVHAVGVGEGIDDLQPFEARAFADSLLGLETVS